MKGMGGMKGKKGSYGKACGGKVKMKTGGKVRGTGCATKGTKARGPMG